MSPVQHQYQPYAAITMGVSPGQPDGLLAFEVVTVASAVGSSDVVKMIHVGFDPETSAIITEGLHSASVEGFEEAILSSIRGYHLNEIEALDKALKWATADSEKSISHLGCRSFVEGDTSFSMFDARPSEAGNVGDLESIEYSAKAWGILADSIAPDEFEFFRDQVDFFISVCNELHGFAIAIPPKSAIIEQHYDSDSASNYEALAKISFVLDEKPFSIDTYIGFDSGIDLLLKENPSFPKYHAHEEGYPDLYAPIYHAAQHVGMNILEANGLSKRSDFDLPEHAGKTLYPKPQGFYEHLAAHHKGALAEYDMTNSMLDYGIGVREEKAGQGRWLALARSFAATPNTLGYDLPGILKEYRESVAQAGPERPLADAFIALREARSDAQLTKPVNALGISAEVGQSLKDLLPQKQDIEPGIGR